MRFLAPTEKVLRKLITFAPATHADVVRKALAKAGAGQIGDYTGCAFTSPGMGYFKPGEHADPFVGDADGPEEAVDEVRIEAVVAWWDVARTVEAIKRFTLTKKSPTMYIL